MASTDCIPDGPPRRLVVFRVGSRLYGVDLEAIREVVPFARATRLPGAPQEVAGLANIRGTIVTVIDLGARLHGVPAAQPDGAIMLAEHAGKLVGMAVDEVTDVRAFAADRLVVVNAAGTGGESVRAAGREDGELITIVHLPAIIEGVLL